MIEFKHDKTIICDSIDIESETTYHEHSLEIIYSDNLISSENLRELTNGSLVIYNNYGSTLGRVQIPITIGSFMDKIPQESFTNYLNLPGNFGHGMSIVWLKEEIMLVPHTYGFLSISDFGIFKIHEDVFYRIGDTKGPRISFKFSDDDCIVYQDEDSKNIILGRFKNTFIIGRKEDLLSIYKKIGFEKCVLKSCATSSVSRHHSIVTKLPSGWYMCPFLENIKDSTRSRATWIEIQPPKYYHYLSYSFDGKVAIQFLDSSTFLFEIVSECSDECRKRILETHIQFLINLSKTCIIYD